MKPIIRAGAHIAGLWALAVVQPLLDVLGRAPEFFVAHRVDAFERAILAVSLAARTSGDFWCSRYPRRPKGGTIAIANPPFSSAA